MSAIVLPVIVILWILVIAALVRHWRRGKL
jgi:hypothetical protein